jgi:hypothetical protein
MIIRFIEHFQIPEILKIKKKKFLDKIEDDKIKVFFLNVLNSDKRVDLKNPAEMEKGEVPGRKYHSW